MASTVRWTGQSHLAFGGLILSRTREQNVGPIPIAYVISAIVTEHAGTEGHLLRLAKRLDRERYQPHLVVLQDSPWTDQYAEQYEDQSTCSPTPLTTMGFGSFLRPNGWLAIRRLAQFFRTHGTKVVELHAVDAHFAGTLAAYLANVPVVISCRRSGGHQYGRKEVMMMRATNGLVNRFLANARFVAERASQLESTRLEQFDVIYNGVDLKRFDELAKGDVSPEFAAACDGKRVVCIAANMRPVKNVGCFVRACAEVAKRFDDVVFALMGDGPSRAGLEDEARQLGIEDRTLWLGSTAEIGPYLKRSHVGCLSSDLEGFSNSIVEYMAAELPVVATHVGGNAEAIVEGETGFTVPAADHQVMADRISDILQMSEASRKKMGLAGRRRVEDRFTMERQLDEFYALYRREMVAAGVQLPSDFR